MAVSTSEINTSLDWRYAAKAYDTGKKISDDDWATLENAMLKAPSSAGVQAYKVITVADPELREKLRGAAFNQQQVTDASHFVVFAAKKEVDTAFVAKVIDRLVEVRGVERSTLEQFEGTINGLVSKLTAADEIVNWNATQAFISLGFLLETAALLRIDASPMGGFDAAKFDEILGLTDHTTVVIAALGYRHPENDWLAPLAKVRWKEDEFFVRR